MRFWMDLCVVVVKFEAASLNWSGFFVVVAR